MERTITGRDLNASRHILYVLLGSLGVTCLPDSQTLTNAMLTYTLYCLGAYLPLLTPGTFGFRCMDGIYVSFQLPNGLANHTEDWESLFPDKQTLIHEC